MKRLSLKDWLLILALCLLGCSVLACLLCSLASCADRKPTLYIALGNDQHSQMLKLELERKWHKPNSELKLTKTELDVLKKWSDRCTLLQENLRKKFSLVYLPLEQVPYPISLNLPAVKINRTEWQAISPRYFLYESQPLVALNIISDRWYRPMSDCVHGANLDNRYNCAEDKYLDEWLQRTHPETKPPADNKDELP